MYNCYLEVIPNCFTDVKNAELQVSLFCFFFPLAKNTAFQKIHHENGNFPRLTEVNKLVSGNWPRINMHLVNKIDSFFILWFSTVGLL